MLRKRSKGKTTTTTTRSKMTEPASGLVQVVLSAGVTAGFHPIAYSKILIQLGYEPINPVPGTTLFGGSAIFYPNVFKYLGHIRKTDGFLGLYRGLGARLTGSIIGSFVTNYVSLQISGKMSTKNARRLTAETGDEIDGDAEDDFITGFKYLLKSTSCEMISRCAGVIASQPFHVIMVRSMAQFLGREEKYTNVFSSVCEIYEKEGVLGFFAGLIPRLVGEALTIWLANTLAHLVNSLLVPKVQGSQDMKGYTSAACSLMVTQVTYPFNLVSNIMAVNGSALAAGQPPFVPVHDSWRDCWRHLSMETQLKRGSSLFWRAYKGPTAIGYDGSIRPAFNRY